MHIYINKYSDRYMKFAKYRQIESSRLHATRDMLIFHWSNLSVALNKNKC